MKNIFLINGGKVFGSSKAQLNSTLHETAKKTLLSLGKDVRECEIDKGYVPSEQVENFLWADAVIWQMPAWWMGEPWIVKKYIDEVFTEGGGRFLTSDGRHRVDPAHGYGTGGLLKDKSYMFSVTWNAPIEAFTEKGEFFEEQGVDGVYFHLHKAMQFVGMKGLPTYICNDVIKNPKIDEFISGYEKHLKKVFG
jgi:modulator of drug activity B